MTPTTLPRVSYGMGEAAAMLGVSRGHLYSLVARGELRTVSLGSRRLIPAAEIRRLVDEGSTDDISED